MEGKFTYLMIYIILLMGNDFVLGSKIDLISSSSSIRPLLTRDFKVTCTIRDTATSGGIVGRSLRESANQDTDVHVARRSLTSTPDNVDFVTSFVLSRDGVDLATMTEHIPAKSLLVNDTEMQVSGQLTGGQPGVKGYLEVTWRHPGQEVAGEYRCDADTVNNQGHSFDFSLTTEVVDQEIGFNDLVRHVHTMEVERDRLEVTQVKDEQVIATFNLTLQALQAENLALKQTMATLQKTCQPLPKIFFSSLLTWDTVIASGQAVVYDGVLVSQGGGYDNRSGIFTAPQDGFYHFEVNALSENSKNFELELHLNNQYVFSVLSLGGMGYQGSSNSATLRLGQHDQVKVVGASTYSQSFLHGNFHLHEALSSFNGRLIALP